MPRRQFVYSVGVLLLAAALRLWRISSLPPGLHHDEAFHLLRAQEIARGQALPVYITGNQGNEPLFAYLSVISLAMLGPVAWAGRLTAAWIGLIGVAATLRVGAEMFPRRAVGAVAGLMLATLYWHLSFSRFGSQPIIVATAAAAAMAALWRGARTGAFQAFALAGLGLALGLWAYVAFRLFPLVALVAGLALLVTGRERRRALLLGGLLAVSVAGILILPLALFFLQNPYWFLLRFGETTRATLASASPATALGGNVLKVLSGLFYSGDGDWKYNLPGRPALDFAQTLFFLVGAGLCLRRWRTPESISVLAWLVVGLAPSALTEPAPQFGRAIMATPALALLAALGIDQVWVRAQRHLAIWRPAVRGLVVVAVFASGVLAVRDYFGRWAHDHGLFSAFDVGLQWMAQQLRAAPTGADLYTTPVYRYYPTFEYTLGPEAFGRLKSFNGRACVVMPSHTRSTTAYAVIVAEDSLTLPALEAAFPAGARVAWLLRGDMPYAAVYQIPAGQTALLSLTTRRYVNYGGVLRMLGYTLASDQLSPGGEFQLRIGWEMAGETERAYKAFVHLVGPPQADGGRLYAQRDAEPCDNSYPTWQWSAGEALVDAYSLALPADLPPGDYSVQVGWYDAAAGDRLPASDEAGGPLGDSVELGQVKVVKP